MIRSPIKWVGGKYKLRKKLISMLPPHQRYVEVFAGAAWVLFGKEPSEYEVLNDIHPEVVNFFKVVKTQPEELISSFRWDLASREEFERLLDLDPQSLDPVDRAHRFFYLVMAGWGGELHRARFQTSISDGGHGNRLIGALKRLEERILLANRRLQNVTIEQQDWRVCVDHYDEDNTVMYLDPPYPSNNCNYEYNMRSMEIHRDIADRMKQSSAKFLLTTYDRPELVKLFSDFDRLHVEFPSGMPSENGRTNKEIIVTNFKPANIPLQLKRLTATKIKREVRERLRDTRESCVGARGPLEIKEPKVPRQKLIAEVVVSLIPIHDCYVELLAGNEMLLPSKPPSSVEVLNDVDGAIVNLFRTTKLQQQEFLASLERDRGERSPSSGKGHVASEPLDKVARAQDFFVQQWHIEFPGLSVAKTIEAIHARLQTVIIERLPWKACIDRYDDERTVICINLYNQQEGRQGDCEELAERIRCARARFIVVACEGPELLQMFSGLNVRQVWSAQVLEDGSHRDQVLVITNFDLGGVVKQRE